MGKLRHTLALPGCSKLCEEMPTGGTQARLVEAKDYSQAYLSTRLNGVYCRADCSHLIDCLAELVFGQANNGHKDLAWMAIQEGLPLRTFMHARGLCNTRHCSRCPLVEETPLHLSWPFAQALLDALENELKNLTLRSSLEYTSVLYGLFPGDHCKETILEAWRLMNCFKDAIWLARTHLVINWGRMSIQDCHRMVLSLLRDYSLMNFPVVAEEED